MADTWGRRRSSVYRYRLPSPVESLPIILVAVMVSAFGTFAFVPAPALIEPSCFRRRCDQAPIRPRRTSLLLARHLA